MIRMWFRCSTAAWIVAAVLSLGGPPARAEVTEIFEAMEAELKRNLSDLRIDKMDAPYYIAYSVIDDDMFSASASFGAVVSAGGASRHRRINVDLRVGDYDFDNTSFHGRSSGMNFGARVMAPLEDDTPELKRSLWLATDGVFKKAAEEIAAKRAAVEKQGPPEEEEPDFIRATPAVRIEEKRNLAIDRAGWRDRITRASAIFRDYPGIENSDVGLTAGTVYRYFVDAEGTRIGQSQFYFNIEISATARTSDGRTIERSALLFENDADRLPTEEKIIEETRKLADDLSSSVAAERANEDYIGPVLMAPGAASVFFQHALIPHIQSAKLGVFDPPEQSQKFLKGDFRNRLGQRVGFGGITVMDIPTAMRFESEALQGNYRFDVEGVAAETVVVIESGVLRNFLTSRTPMKGMAGSNGHARAQIGYRPEARVGNLIIGGGRHSFAELQERLAEQCADEGFSHGIVITSLSEPSGPGGFSGGRSMVFFGGMGGGSNERDVLVVDGAYRIDFATGETTPVRDFQIAKPRSRELRAISAIGFDRKVFNYEDRKSSSGRVFSAIVSPAILLREIELLKAKPPTEKPRLLTHPYFSRRGE